ncbi:MAG: FHA domain-containing protein [Clostridiales bacterium]|nr:FHA domain-containing protein [Clostridiales bacterium]MBP3811036.1 FHA domain-containing protein [Clostridiales bacterium]
MKDRSLLRKVSSAVLSIFLVSMVFTSSVFAEGSPATVSIRPTNNGIYVHLIGDPISDINIQIGDSLTSVESFDEPIRTMILVDNSISTYEALVKHGSVNNATRQSSIDEAPLPGNIEGDSLVPFLQQVVSSREDGESFRLGIFNDNIGLFWACDWSTDYDLINTAIASVAYADYDTSVSNALYDAISSIPDDGIYTRIIVVSDCVNDGLYDRGYGEFVALEDSKQVSLYLIGIDANNNSDSISDMEEIVRTAPRYSYITTSDGSNLNDISGALSADHSIQSFIAVPDNNVYTGSTMGVLINMTTEFGDFSLSDNVIMPINPVTPTPLPTPTSTPAPTPTPEPTATPVPEEEESLVEEESNEDNSSSNVNVAAVTTLVILLLAGLGIAIWFFVVRNPMKKKKSSSSTLSVIKDNNSVKPVQEKPTKKLVSVFKGEKETKTHTVFVDTAGFFALKASSGIELNSYNFIKFRDNEIIIGTDSSCDFCINDGTLGPKHCIISKRDNQYYLKDLGNANPTKYNGVTIENREMLIQTDGVLELGRESFKVQFKVEEKRV